jgi:hypothetical protein
MNAKEVEQGIGCYTTRPSYIFTDGTAYEVGESYRDCPAGFWLCGVKHPDQPVEWV